MYTPATKLPSSLFFQWGTPTAPNPTLAANLEPGDTTVYFSTPPYDHTGAILTGDFNFGVKNSKSYVMTCYVPAGGMAADGLSATLVQGVRLEGLDFTTEDSSLVPSDGFKQGDAVFCNISGVIGALFRAAINGTIATGGTGFVIGTEPGAGGETITVYRTTTAGVKKGILRWYITNGKVEYSNDGTTWVAIDDTVASVLLKNSATDTTPGYNEDKNKAGNGVVATRVNSGANEYLQWAIDLATNSGLEFSGGKVRIKLADASLALSASGLSATGNDTKVDNSIVTGEDLLTNSLVSVNSSGQVVYSRYGAGVNTTSKVKAIDVASCYPIDICYLADNLVVAAYVDGSNRDLYLVAGNVNARTKAITWGSPTVFKASITGTWCGIKRVNATTFIAVGEDSTTGYMVAGTVSGTTISLGAVSTLSSQTGLSIDVIGTDKALYSYIDGADSSKGKCAVVSLTGTTIAIGTPVVFSTNAPSATATTKLDTDKAIIYYVDTADSNKGKASTVAIALTVPSPSASITWYAGAVTIDLANRTGIRATQVTTDASVIIYRDGTNNRVDAIDCK